MRGWECAAVDTPCRTGGTLAYALFKQAGSFSANAEGGAVGGAEGLEAVPELTLLDFGWARGAEDGLEDGEAWLLRLAHTAAAGFFGVGLAAKGVALTVPVALAPGAAGGGAVSLQGEWMYCDLAAAAAGQPTSLDGVVDQTNHLVVPIDEF